MIQGAGALGWLAVFSPARLAAAAAAPAGRPLEAPKAGKIPVAFLTSDGANVIDTAGPWEVFQDVHLESRGSSHDDMMPFRLFTVAQSKSPVRMTGGLHVVPDYSVDDAPQPRVIVVPAMRGSARTLEWLRAKAPATDVTMSVCTGAFQLARAGLLDGLAATTHHDFWDGFARDFPKVKLERGPRFVEGSERIATAGGLTSGIDMALRVVSRYFGVEAAAATARYMEYEGQGWRG
jgi:transcriptional regulator GlxA family with amidase domain